MLSNSPFLFLGSTARFSNSRRADLTQLALPKGMKLRSVDSLERQLRSNTDCVKRQQKDVVGLTARETEQMWKAHSSCVYRHYSVVFQSSWCCEQDLFVCRSSARASQKKEFLFNHHRFSSHFSILSIFPTLFLAHLMSLSGFTRLSALLNCILQIFISLALYL